VKAIKSDSDSDSDEQKQVARLFRKNRGVTPSVAAPGVTHPSDATVVKNMKHSGLFCGHASPHSTSDACFAFWLVLRMA